MIRSRFAILCLLLASLTSCASSSSQLLAPARPPINPADVRIYHAPPRHYQEIATLDATSGARFFHGTPQGEAEAIERLKIEAAKVGANGVLLTLVGDRPSGSLGVGVGGGDVSFHHHGGTEVAGAASGSAPIVQNGAAGIAIYVFDRP